MKKIVKSILIVFAFTLFCACSKEQLDVSNPNDPTFDAIESESGITQLATGTYNTATFGVAWGFYWVVNAYHEAMGDAIYIPWGNFGFRWTNQPTSITLDDGTVVTPPQEGAQGEALEVRNVRTQTTGNAFAWEWESMYRVNNTSNLLLSLLDGTEFSGDADLKKAVFRSWGYYWKGYAYSRIGSMYTAGLILDEPGTTTGNYVSNTEILAEAKRNLDLAKAELEQISGSITNVTSNIIPDNLVPSPFRGSSPSTVLTRDAWIRNINTLLARNLLVNKKVSDMTTADWTQITTLTNEGIQPSDFVFVMKQDGNNFEISTNVNTRFAFGWHFLSERLVQDFKTGDQRYDDNVQVLGSAEVNRAGRGIQYGTRFGLIENADYSITENNKANIYFAGTYSENELMKAEALIFSSQTDAGLALIDGIRDHQQAALPATSGTGLNMDEALEELRVERRIGLFLRGVTFYDARRWDITKTPRSGLSVLDGLGNVNTNATFNYNYLDYWSVPDQELEFNEPNEGSVPVVSPN
tara:strand:- start:553 stop:2127 length:1575 start_codon:yes stop_codon:yes gene_type:complete